MKSTTFKYFRRFCALFAVLFLMLSNGNSQTLDSKRGIDVGFTNKKTEQLSNELSSNILRIKNNTSKSYTFSVDISAPDGWKFISRKNTNYTISPNDSIFVPVNLIPKKSSNGNINHLVNATLINDDGVQFASTIWYLNIRKESAWNASVSLNKVFFLEESDLVPFSVKLQNSGNADEKIKISFASERHLRVLDPLTRKEITFYNLNLAIKTDTVISFIAEKLSPRQTTFRQDISNPLSDLKAEVLPLRVIVQNEADEYTPSKTWRGTIEFIKTGTEAQLREHKYSSLPLTIDASIDNIMDYSTILNLSLYGVANFDNNRNLMYRFQTYFSNNFYSYLPYLGNSHYVGYSSPKTSLEIGDVSGNANFGFTPSGRGIKASQEILKNNTIGAFYIQSPKFLSDLTKTDYGLSHGIRFGRNSIENFVQRTDNELLKFTGEQYSNRIRLNFFRFHNLVLNSAFSREIYDGAASPITKTGYAYLINYAGAFKKLNLSLNHSYGSPYNTNYRGINSLSGSLSYWLSKKNNVEGSYFSFKQNPSYINSTGFLLNTRTTGSELYQLKYNYNPFDYSISLKLQHLYSEVFNLRTEANGLGVDFRPRAVGSLRFFLSLSGYYNNLLDYKLDPYFSSQIRSTIRYKGLTSSIRYMYGPYQTFEQLLFAKTQVNNQSIYTNTNLKMWVLRDKVSFEPSSVLSYETLFKRTRLSFRPEFYYLPKNGLELRFYSQYINNTQKNNPFIDLNNFGGIDQNISSSNLFFGLGLKKKIGVPISGKKYNDLKVAVFKDINGNGRQDKNEIGVKNILVNIKPLNTDSATRPTSYLQEMGENFVTDEEGRVAYKNLPRGAYKISIVPLTENAGFFAGNEQTVTLTDDRLVSVPLNQGVQLAGILTSQRDVVAADFDRRVDVSKIRITATDSLGKSYSTITDAEGHFNLRVPVGIYTVVVNENALPDNFELQQKRILVEMLTIADNYNITFNLVEKKRKINVKKFDQQGKILENKDNSKLKNNND